MVYVVVGISGELDTRQEWPVIAFLDEKLAMDYASELNIQAEQNRQQIEDGEDIELSLDPETIHTYEMPRYQVAKVKLGH